MLSAALGERAHRLALEIGDDEVVLDHEDLPEVIVAVIARLARLDRGRFADISQEIGLACDQTVG